MFKYFREMRKLKKEKLLFEAALMGKLYGFVDALPDIVELAEKAKDLDITQLQKLFVEELVNYTKNKEVADGDDTPNEE